MRDRMFRLLRYFSLTSAAALTASATALVMVYRADQLAEHTTAAEAENARMAESFAKVFLPHVNIKAAQGQQMGAKPPRAHPQGARTQATAGLHER
jgi:hypothetical protein